MEFSHFESLYPDSSRAKEIERILSFVKEGNSCQLIGLPGVGRGTLLGFLTYNKQIRLKHLGDNQKWFHFVLVNFSEMRNRDFFTVTKFLFLSLTESLREREMHTEYEIVNKIFKESLSMQDEMVLFQGLKRTIDYLALEQQLTIVFLFDRFEDYVPTLTSEFFSNLRVLRNRAKYRFSAVFSLNKPLEDLVEPALFAEFHEFLAGHMVYMAVADMPGLEFRLNYLEKVTGKKVDQKLQEKIIELTGGQGKLTRLAVEACLMREDESVVIPSEVEESLAHARSSANKLRDPSTPRRSAQDDSLLSFLLSQRTVTGGLKEIWRSFSPAEQQWILGKNRTEENKGIEDYMRHIHFIVDGKIQIPLFQAFLDQNVKTAVSQVEKIAYDEATNTIAKGKLVLSDDLTASEFRLLKYFLVNPDQIVDREKIVSVVWGDNASVAGVTEQAIDQLIFRLRKKIENDPKQPVHLQTVKGRGVRFSS